MPTMHNRMKIAAIIPARGGSKAIPGKNIYPLAGKPLLAHTIEQARKAESVQRVVVSTDDPQIGKAAKKYGAEVIKRPKKISGDRASSEAALLHALSRLERKEGYQPDLVVFLQCTSPLSLAEDIDGTVKALLRKKADTALAVAGFDHFLWQEKPAGASGINHDKSKRVPRQKRKNQFIEAGSVYVMRRKGFLKAKHRFFGKTVMHIIAKERNLEIDEPSDLAVARALLRKQALKERLAQLPAKVGAVVFDFDGVFTDNSVVVRPEGREEVTCSRMDGLGVSLLRKKKIPMLVLSSEENQVTQERAKKLKIEILSNIKNKKVRLKEWAAKKRIPLSSIVYVGNDINDKECLTAVGCGMVVKDAHDTVKNVARIILSNKGGRGAVREAADLILKKTARKQKIRDNG